MSLFNFFKSTTSSKSNKSDYELAQTELFNYLHFSKEQGNGLMFFLGMTLPISAFKSKVFDSESLKNDNSKATDFVLSLLKLQSNCSYNWDNYQDILDFELLQSRIYNFNFIYWKCLKKSEENIDDLLKTIPELDITIGKTSLDNNWVQKYFDSDFNLNNVNQLYYDFFESIGAHTLKKGLTQDAAFAAGFAFYNFILPKDLQGSHFLISTISDSCTPLFTALQEAPILYKFHKKAFLANHIFSSTFQFFTMGIDMEILGPIHRFHQFLFYENGSSSFRKEWDFNSKDKNFIIAQAFHNAISFRQSGLVEDRTIYINSKEIFNKDLINKTIDKSTFFVAIQNVILQKYGCDFKLSSLRSTGDFIGLIAMLYYETCIHAIVLDEIN
jgi:hypothetical protein